MSPSHTPGPTSCHSEVEQSEVSQGLPTRTPDFFEQDHPEALDNIIPTRGYQLTPMVALGGSAGSIGVLQEFFRTLPEESGMVFVVILHLARDHESSLAHVLARCTKMPVVQAVDRQKVLPNHVYVIPPGKELATVEGHLILSELNAERGKRVVVDLFFRSLADSHGPHGAAVVLSGADGDGALGIKRIKERGGLTVAQDPDEAEHAGMPASAIDTGMVDWVLPVAQMAQRLLNYFHQEKRLQLPPEEGPQPAQQAHLSPDQAEAALREVLAYLRTRTGRDFSYYKRATILRRIARRMQVNAMDNLPAYLGYLRTHPGEAGALLQDLLISVTNFFRDREAFAVLEKHIPQLFEGKGHGEPVRVWVPACATGEEAYSIAMLLQEHARTLDSPPPLQVFACDLDEEAIAVARAGLYPESMVADVSEDRVRKFFVKDHRGYRVRREVREMVLFASHDLLKDAPFSRMDLIACRNLLIYLNRGAQKRVFDTFHFASKPGALLFLGTSESVEEDSALFRAVDKKNRLYAHQPAARVGVPVPTGPSSLMRAVELQERARTGPVVHGRRFAQGGMPGLAPEVPVLDRAALAEFHFKLVERLAPPSVIVSADHEIVHLSENAGRFFKFVGGEPSNNLLRIVDPTIRVELRAGLFRAAETNTTVTLANLPVEVEGHTRLLNIRISPASEISPGFLLVIFEARSADSSAQAPAKEEQGTPPEPLIRQLERELEQVKNQLHDTVEQYDASTEEMKASNRNTRRAALNLMEDVAHARRAEQRAAAERQRAEVEVRASLMKYRNLFDSIDEGFCILEVMFENGQACDYRFREANPAFEKQTGLANVIGRTIREIAPEQAADERLAIYGRVALTGEAQRFEHSAGLPGRAYDIYAFRVDEGGRHRVAVLHNDITDRKRREVNLAFLAEIAADLSRLSSAEEIMQAVGARVGAFLHITSCNFVDVNEARDELRLVHGWNQDPAAEVREPLRITQYLGAGFHEAGRAGETMVVKDTAGDERTDGAAYAGLQIGAFVIVPFYRDGAWRHFLAITDSRPREWRVDEVELFQEVANRVFPRLERARVEEALRNSEERNRIALDAAAMAAWDYDVVADSIAWNEQHYRILGLEPDHKEKKTADFLAYVHPDDCAAVKEALRVGMEESGIYQAEFRIVRTDGKVRWMCGFGKAIESRGGRAVRMGGVMYDVTERHEAEEALATALRQTRIAQQEAEAANRAKDRFLAVLSHELRTPLTPALMATHMLLEEKHLSEDTRDVLEMIQRNITLEGKLVDDLLDITRITRGMLKLDPAPVDLHQVIRHAHDICLPDIEAKRQVVDLALEATSRAFSGDTARLQQVVWNLLKNACKFSPVGSRIQVRTCDGPGCVMLQVADRGIGLEPDSLTCIFDAFTQANDGIMRRFGGLGLGLAISKAVVEAHGGRIWAESEGPGNGTTFKVFLPVPAV